MDFSNLANSIASGALSGAITASTLQPLEYIKTRLQQPNSTGQPTISSIVKSTLRDDQGRVRWSNGAKLWNGLSPSLGRTIPVAAIYFGFIDTFRNSALLSHSKQGGRYQMWHSFVIGAAARSFADVLTFPLSLIKTRFESDCYSYKNVFSAFNSIYKLEGFAGLFKGLNATLIRDVSYSGLYFMIYTKIKTLASSQSGSSDTVRPQSSLYFASCALASSVLACAITQPPDVIRSYMQLEPAKYRTFPSTMKQIYTNKGLAAFFNGFIPRSTRRVLISILSWTIYEKMSIKV